MEDHGLRRGPLRGAAKERRTNMAFCPYCGSEDTWLVQGNEVNIKEIEAQ